jgi:hypothetical protein
MRPLPKVNGFKVWEIDGVVEAGLMRMRERGTGSRGGVHFEFGGGLVFVEFLEPVGMGKRGDDACDGAPFCDAKAGLCEASDGTDDDDAEGEGGREKEPAADAGRRGDRGRRSSGETGAEGGEVSAEGAGRAGEEERAR